LNASPSWEYSGDKPGQQSEAVECSSVLIRRSTVPGGSGPWIRRPKRQVIAGRAHVPLAAALESQDGRSPPAHFLDRDSPTSGPSCRSTAVLVGWYRVSPSTHRDCAPCRKESGGARQLSLPALMETSAGERMRCAVVGAMASVDHALIICSHLDRPRPDPGARVRAAVRMAHACVDQRHLWNLMNGQPQHPRRQQAD
jgi:hypothetical protein